MISGSPASTDDHSPVCISHYLSAFRTACSRFERVVAGGSRPVRAATRASAPTVVSTWSSSSGPAAAPPRYEYVSWRLGRRRSKPDRPVGVHPGGTVRGSPNSSWHRAGIANYEALSRQIQRVLIHSEMGPVDGTSRAGVCEWSRTISRSPPRGRARGVRPRTVHLRSQRPNSSGGPHALCAGKPLTVTFVA